MLPFDRAMILAAGQGTRLKPLTDTLPKPLIEVGGKAIIEHTVLALRHLGIGHIIINAHHLAAVLMEHLGDGSAYGVHIAWSHETQLMNTGGGICQALPLLGAKPFLAINGDIYWHMDLRPWLNLYQPDNMLAYLGLVPNPEGKKGDFIRTTDGSLITGQGPSSLTYSGIQILNPQGLRHYSVCPFGLMEHYQYLIEQHQLFGEPLNGLWSDMGTPQGLERARQMAKMSS